MILRVSRVGSRKRRERKADQASGGRACGRRAGPRGARRALIGPRRPAPFLSLEITPRALLILLLAKTAASAISIGSGFRGGLFFASLLLGAVLGKLFAGVVATVALPAVDPMLRPPSA